MQELDLIHPYLTHPLTGCPLRAVGVRRNGAPIWPILGGAPDDGDESGDGGDDSGDDSGAGDEESEEESGADKLGDAGKQALDRMKTQRNAARDQLREFKALGLTPAQIKKLTTPDGDEGDRPDAEQIRREADTAANSRVNDKLKRAQVLAAAAGKLANPKLAPQLINLDQFEVDDNGDVDEDEIAEAIADLLKHEPYLAAAQGRKFGDPDAGPRGEARAKQVTEAELERMSPTEVVKARKEGRLDHLLKKT